MGWVVCAIIVLTILFNLVIIIRDLIKSLRKYFIKYYNIIKSKFPKKKEIKSCQEESKQLELDQDKKPGEVEEEKSNSLKNSQIYN